MKRIELIKHLQENNCVLEREGTNHTLYRNLLTDKISSIPRHTEIGNILANEICKQLAIPKVR
jgi:hypothetical protein